MNRASIPGRDSLLKVYKNLYPWNSLDQFIELIKSTIAYRSPDNSLIALNKPFGVGTFTTLDHNTSKQNTDKILYNLSGAPKYCLSDVLDSLSQEFNSTSKYFIIKGIDRYMSGLVLITNDEKNVINFKRSLSAARVNKQPPFGFRALTNGYPTIKSEEIYERVGLEQLEVDAFGEFKEPLVSLDPGSTFLKKKNKKMFQAELKTIGVNRDISAASLELYTSSLAWDFPRCYISSKTAFILGDVRFSKRIREVLGKKMQVSAFKSSGRYDDSYEPLSVGIAQVLGVKKNNQIPLMLDLFCLRLKYFDRKTKEDLIIRSQYVPSHLALTAKRLNLPVADRMLN